MKEGSQGGLERHLYNLRKSCRAKKKEVPETVTETFSVAKGLLLSGGSADSPDAYRSCAFASWRKSSM